MEGKAVGNNFERDPPKDHPCHVWCNLVQQFQRKRFKKFVEDLQMIIPQGSLVSIVQVVSERKRFETLFQ